MKNTNNTITIKDENGNNIIVTIKAGEAQAFNHKCEFCGCAVTEEGYTSHILRVHPEEQ